MDHLKAMEDAFALGYQACIFHGEPSTKSMYGQNELWAYDLGFRLHKHLLEVESETRS